MLGPKVEVAVSTPAQSADHFPEPPGVSTEPRHCGGDGCPPSSGTGMHRGGHLPWNWAASGGRGGGCPSFLAGALTDLRHPPVHGPATSTPSRGVVWALKDTGVLGGSWWCCSYPSTRKVLSHRGAEGLPCKQALTWWTLPL